MSMSFYRFAANCVSFDLLLNYDESRFFMPNIARSVLFESRGLIHKNDGISSEQLQLGRRVWESKSEALKSVTRTRT